MVRTSVQIVFLILAFLAADIARSDERPNFLVIVTDDMGFTVSAPSVVTIFRLLISISWLLREFDSRTFTGTHGAQLPALC